MFVEQYLIDKLPVFLALPCARLNKESDPRIKLDIIFNALEAVIRLEVALLIAETLRRNQSLPEEVKNIIERPSFGNWLQMFRALKKGSDQYLGLDDKSAKFVAKAIQVRNEKAHSLSFFSERAEQELGCLRSDFLKIMQNIADRPSEIHAGPVDIRGIKIDWSNCLADTGDVVFTQQNLTSACTNRLSPLFIWGKCETTASSSTDKLVKCYSSAKRVGNKKQKLKLVYDCFDPNSDYDTEVINDIEEQFQKLFGLNISCLRYARNESAKFIDPNLVNILQPLTQWLDDKEQNNRFFLIQGSPGTGKSALLAYWAIQYKEQNSDTKLVYHRFSPGTDWFSWEGFESSCMEQLKCLPNKTENVLYFIDGLDLIKQYDHATYNKIKRLSDRGRWVVTASYKSDLPSDFKFNNRFEPPLLSLLSIRALLANLQRDITDQILRQDRELLTEDKVINPFIEAVYSHSESGNPMWLQLLCEDLESGRLNPYDIKSLPQGLDGYAENAQQTLQAQRKAYDRLVNREVIHLPGDRKKETFWLDYCEQAYDELLETPLPTRIGVRSQPVWPMDSVLSIESKKNSESEWEIQPFVIGEEGNSAFDILAWYSPSHFDGADRYGIYLPYEGIVHLADELFNLLAKACKKLSKRSLIHWAALILHLHEMGHAFIERLVFSMERHSGIRSYEKAAQRYSGLILMEEALCNTFVCGMHQAVLKKIGNEDLSNHSQELHKALITYMRQQPAGYRDFVEISVLPQQSRVFVENCKAILKFVYEIDEVQQNLGVDELLSNSESVIWKDYVQDLELLQFISCDHDETKSDITDEIFESLGHTLFPWAVPIYVLGAKDSRRTVHNDKKTPAWDMRNALRTRICSEAQMMFKREDGKILLNSVNLPGGISGSFLLCNSKIADFSGFPKQIHGNLYCMNNQITSLSKTNKYIERIDGLADFSGNPIESSPLLSLLRIKGLQSVRLVKVHDTNSRLYQAQQIINKHLKNGRDLIACQEDLFKNDLDEFAQL